MQSSQGEFSERRANEKAGRDCAVPDESESWRFCQEDGRLLKELEIQDMGYSESLIWKKQIQKGADCDV